LPNALGLRFVKSGEKAGSVSAGQLAPPLAFGHYPTPVQRIDALSTGEAELWVKRDDCTHDVYGVNKVRKLEWLLADAHARGAKRLVTVGAAGSHHVLATTYFGTREGFEVEAVLVPQPRTDHVVEVLRAGLALGLHAVAVRSWGGAALAIAHRMVTAGKDTRLITVGGSNVVGAMGYVAAARELAAQVRAGVMPEPDTCVVCVSQPPWALRLASRRLARACARRASCERAGGAPPRLRMDARFLGRGYGHSTAEGDEATRIASAAGLVLDPTYTAKAFASALWHVRARKGRVILYWHTLSSAPMGPLLAGAPKENELDPRLRRVLLVASER
jgi:D-cysteine desulfhydrase